MTDNILIDKNQESIETWAYIEIMGHSRIAGRVSEKKVGIQVMLQVDVPKADEGFSHTEFYSPSAIFSIKPTTEEWCRRWIASHRSYEVLPYIPPTRQLQPKDETGVNVTEDKFNTPGYLPGEDEEFFDDDDD